MVSYVLEASSEECTLPFVNVEIRVQIRREA